MQNAIYMTLTMYRYATQKLTSFDCIQTGTVGKSMKIPFYVASLNFFTRPNIKKVMSFLRLKIA